MGTIYYPKHVKGILPAELKPSRVAIASSILSIPAPAGKLCNPIRSARTVYLILFPPARLPVQTVI